jgi:MFS family permease
VTGFQRYLVLIVCFLALLFDGVELGLMPIASLSVSESLLAESYTDKEGTSWFARFAAALMLGAAVGGIALGNLGDRIGRTRAMGFCILVYSVFAALGSWASTQEQMLLLRFLVGLGVGGLWPNGIALVSECWPGVSRPFVSGAMMAGLNLGILLLSQVARFRPITPDSWRWLFQLAGAPALLGILVLAVVPESPQWLANRGSMKKKSTPLRELFGKELIRFTLIGILLSAIPMIGAWSASKWMIPWAETVAGKANPGYKAETQGWWALGATLGSFFGAQVAHWLGRKWSYLGISIATFAVTSFMFLGTEPLQSIFHPIVFIQGFVATLFFGWLALSLPELYPVRVRATGTGLAYNSGRFATAVGVMIAGSISYWLGGSYPKVGAICATIYALGMVVVLFMPKVTQDDLK